MGLAVLLPRLAVTPHWGRIVLYACARRTARLIRRRCCYLRPPLRGTQGLDGPIRGACRAIPGPPTRPLGPPPLRASRIVHLLSSHVTIIGKSIGSSIPGTNTCCRYHGTTPWLLAYGSHLTYRVRPPLSGLNNCVARTSARMAHTPTVQPPDRPPPRARSCLACLVPSRHCAWRTHARADARSMPGTARARGVAGTSRDWRHPCRGFRGPSWSTEVPRVNPAEGGGFPPPHTHTQIMSQVLPGSSLGEYTSANAK